MRLIDADAMLKRNEHSIYDTTDLKEMLDYEPTVICENCEYESAVKDIRLILTNFRPESMIDNVYNKLCKKYNIKV
jgi:hypothetical protein